MKKSIVVLLSFLLTVCIPLTTAEFPEPAALPTIKPASSPTSVSPTPGFTPSPTLTPISMLQPGEPATLANIYPIDEQTGWGIESQGHIVRTSDGGTSWKDVTPPNSNGAYQNGGFFALDAYTAWATPIREACFSAACTPPDPTSAAVWHTKDGGNMWQEQYVCLSSDDCNYPFDIFAEYYYPISLQFLDEKTGWLLVVVNHLMFQDRYRVYETKDSGLHWSALIDNMAGPMTMSVTGLAFRDYQIGWMGTSDIGGATDPRADWSLYQSTDAGHTWDVSQLPAPDPLPETFAPNLPWCGIENLKAQPPDWVDITFLCVVYEKDQQYSYHASSYPPYYFSYHSADGGRNWASWQKTGDVEFINPTVGWRLTVNDNTYNLEQTHDGGISWVSVKIVPWSGDLDFVSEQVGWAITTSGESLELVHTNDGGRTWQEVKPVVSK